ncbi:general secretion pathway protein D [Halopseudomonas litoralis]|uniref:General secretion pathway protein D n=1 Tax=Halopseudomonas litoralis TaxID=797277 RepID=A0A1H1Q8K2_9GAMM|nr:type II secretion system secretin GspD [Halopseudomonas litoralis]SDS19831.1 general secretion pathway protein D [Halopseudomonas litoralis]
MKQSTLAVAVRRHTLIGCLALVGCATTSEEQPLYREGTYVPSSTLEDDRRSQAQTRSAIPEKPLSDRVSEHVTRPVGQRSPRAGPSLAGQPQTAMEDQAVLNFIDSDIQSVITGLSRFLGRNFLIDPRVKGNITLVSEGEIPADTAYDMLVSALRMRGFTIVDVGDVSRVVPVADARIQGGAVNADQPGGGIATRTFQLDYESAESLVDVLKPMIAPENSIQAYAANNTLVVTDYIDNLERIAHIIDSIDTPTSLDTDVVKVHNGVAVDIAGLAGELLQGENTNASNITVLADPRSNSVIIRSSSPARTALARDLIIKLDNAQDDPGNLHVVYLRNAQATYLSEVLRGLLTGDSAGQSAFGSGTDSARAALGGGGMMGGASSSSNSSTAAQPAASGGVGNSQRFGANASGAQQGIPGSIDGGTAFSANGVTVQADATTNTLIISAPEPMYRSLRRVIDLLDQRRAQVLVESLIVEVNENNSAELGIQWMKNNGRFIGGANLGGSGLNMNASNTLDLLPSGLNLGVVDGTINIPGVGEIMNLEVLARALQTDGGANILSTPNILTLDNEEASIMVGKTVPFVSGSYVTSGSSSDNPFQTVEREDVGLQLNIRPQISEGGTVKLDIYQEVSSLDMTGLNIGGIVTNKRALDTSVLLDDGQIMVLGGLLEDSVSTTTNSVPLLGSIPGLGHLFRYENRDRVKTNLMIFLRPYVIRDAEASRGLTQDRYDFMRIQQSRAQPGKHPLLPDINAPILPPTGVPVAGEVDLRPQQWPITREQNAPATETRSQVRQLPGQSVSITTDLAALHATPDNNKTVLQIADVASEEEAVAITQRVRSNDLPAYIVRSMSGSRFAVRVELPRDAANLDASTGVLRAMGYQPEIVVAP